MSDIPKPDDEEDEDDRVQFNFKMPPPPEDQFVMTGDLLSLFVYAFTDHFVCQDLASFANAGVKSEEIAAIASRAGTADSILSSGTPVWLDHSSGYRDQVLHVLLSDHTVTQYSPLLQPTGLAACVLAAAWLGCGWWNRAFSFKNTLDCRADRALVVTARTWLATCAVLLFGVAVTNAALLGDGLHLTKGDADYILDSLSVLCLWRFIASSMLGSGGGGGSRED